MLHLPPVELFSALELAAGRLSVAAPLPACSATDVCRAPMNWDQRIFLARCENQVARAARETDYIRDAPFREVRRFLPQPETVRVDVREIGKDR